MISVVVLTKNEEKNIVDCIESILWCDEIVIVDDNSYDRTVEIIKNLKNEKIKIFTHSLENDFSAQRNYGLEKARGEWVLFVDADERITNELKNEIVDVTFDYGREQKLHGYFGITDDLKSKIKHLTIDSDRVDKLNGYFIKRRDVMWERELKYGETGNIRLLRLARRDAGRWVGKVHEVWKVKGRIGELKNSLFHYPHQTITEFLKEINFYTDIRAKELFNNKVKVYWWSILIYPLGKFILNYGIKRGFLDGLPGFIFGIIMSFHSFLVRGKLWLLSKKP